MLWVCILMAQKTKGFFKLKSETHWTETHMCLVNTRSCKIQAVRIFINNNVLLLRSLYELSDQNMQKSAYQRHLAYKDMCTILSKFKSAWPFVTVKLTISLKIHGMNNCKWATNIHWIRQSWHQLVKTIKGSTIK